MVVAAFGLAACKSSVDNEKQRYTAARDRLDALGTKQPQLKADIQRKLVEFEQREKEAEAKKGDDAIKALQAVVAQMDSYEKMLNPTTPSAPATSAAATSAPGVPPTSSAAPPMKQTSSGSGFGGH
jgi:hypothetical protein